MRIEHTCHVSTNTTRVSAKWLAVKYESLFRSDIITGIQTLIDACMEKYGVDVPKTMAYRAKNLAIEVVLGEHKKQYPRLRDYAQTVMDTNPGSRVVLFLLADPGVDGCFIKLTTGSQLLASTGRDGNDNIYPLAFGIVGKEDRASWCWFLHQLKICLGGEVGQFGPYTIMFDRQKGEDLKKYMGNAAYAYSEHKFNIGMTAFRSKCEEAWKWLSAIPKKTWARHAFDTNCKTDLVVNNLSEVLNKYVLDVRKKPIRTMCDGIKDKQMVRWHRNRENGKKARWEITPHYSENLEVEKERAKFCKPIQVGVDLWQVTSEQQTHAVNLQLQTCGCRKWDLTGIPFPTEQDWTRTPGPYIGPREFKVKRGRKKEKMIKGKFEVPTSKDTSRMGTITCGNCGLQGHRYTNCMKQLKPELALRKNKHVPTSRNSNVAGVAAVDPTPPPRASNPAPTPPPRASNPAPTTATTAGTGFARKGGADRVAAGRGGARRGAGRGGGRGAGIDVGRGSRGFYAPRQSAASTSAAPQPSDGRHSG
ncbi:hypothetical protein D1007_60859 [Hordeum vulgare]|nr:hypothetical protein D1007_60859 [Hordeum vulgare]